MLIIDTETAQTSIAAQMRQMRLASGLTQEGLSYRSGVSLPTLRKFEQKGVISLESFLKLAMVLRCLEKIVDAMQSSKPVYKSIEDVLKDKPSKPRQRGWRK